SLGVTIEDDFEEYSVQRSNNQFGFRQMEDCNTILHSERILYNGSTSIPSYRFPIDVEVVVENPTGGSDTVINDVWTSMSDQNKRYDLPFYYGETYNYTITFTDDCGETYTRVSEITAIPRSRILTLAAECGSRFIRIDQLWFYDAPIEVTFLNYPAGFDPADYNPNFTPGAFTGTIDPLTNIDFGNATTAGVPEGTYEIELSTCGRTEIKTITVSNDITYRINSIRNWPGCGDNEGAYNFYIAIAGGPNQQADDITSVTIINAPAAYTGSTDISYGITPSGQFAINSLPSGEYTLEVTGSCGIPINYTFNLLSKNLMSTV